MAAMKISAAWRWQCHQWRNEISSIITIICENMNKCQNVNNGNEINNVNNETMKICINENNEISMAYVNNEISINGVII
jgi:hypothetical protein